MIENWTRRKLLGVGATLAGVLSLNPMQALAQSARKFTWKNWGGNLSSEPKNITAPESEQAIIDLLKTSW